MQPYIMKAYFGMPNPPVKIAKIAIGDGSLGSAIENEQMPVLTVIETYPQLISYDPTVYQSFKEQYVPWNPPTLSFTQRAILICTGSIRAATTSI